VSDRLLVLDAEAILSPFDSFSPGRLVVRHDRIEAVGLQADVQAPSGSDRVDLKGFTLVPGFIEPHVHGCGGHDVMEATTEALSTISATLAHHGTTSFLATTVSAPVATLTSVIEQLGKLLPALTGGARPLGIHLEGPFLSPDKRGTHDSANIYPPDASVFESWIQKSGSWVRLLTLAPELVGAAHVADVARTLGITLGMGHSNATFEQASAAADQGTRYAVHTFNAMRPFSHRDPGIVGAVLSDDRVFAEIIADGVHVAPEVVKVFAKAKGSTRVILACDATSATGMPDGQYALGSGTVRMTGGVCRDDEGRLAGSTLTQDRALRNLIQWTGMTLNDAVLSLTSNPAEALSLPDRGKLIPGAVADIVALDLNLQVVRTYVSGALVWQKKWTN
jgi:N-acetylglucosamine-6-phosphate deacetylase